MKLFPIALNLEGRPCLVVGEGPETDLRAERLLEAGARVVVVSANPPERVRELARAGALTLHQRSFEPRDVQSMWLVVLADEDAEAAACLAALCDAQQTLFCAIDQPAFNSFAHVSTFRSGALLLSISSEGRAPALARRMRELLQELFSRSGLDAFSEAVAQLRDETPREQRRKRLGDLLKGMRLHGSLELPPLS